LNPPLKIKIPPKIFILEGPFQLTILHTQLVSGTLPSHIFFKFTNKVSHFVPLSNLTGWVSSYYKLSVCCLIRLLYPSLILFIILLPLFYGLVNIFFYFFCVLGDFFAQNTHFFDAVNRIGPNNDLVFNPTL